MGPSTLRAFWTGVLQKVGTQKTGLLSECNRPPFETATASRYALLTLPLSRDEFTNHLLFEVGRASCDMLGTC